MTRVCELTGKRPAVANNVSHSNRKTKRRQLPNLQKRSFFSRVLEKSFTLRVSTNVLRTIDKLEGFDKFMLSRKDRHAQLFSDDAKKIRREIRKAAAEAK